MNQKKVRGLRWKDILTCETVVWGGQKSLGARLRWPGFATQRWWHCFLAILNPHWSEYGKKGDSENTLESEECRFHSGFIHFIVRQSLLLTDFALQCPHLQNGVIMPPTPLERPTWKSYGKPSTYPLRRVHTQQCGASIRHGMQISTKECNLKETKARIFAKFLLRMSKGPFWKNLYTSVNSISTISLWLWEWMYAPGFQ